MAIHTVKLFRRIRDEYYKTLKDKTFEERKAFYHKKAMKVNEHAENLINLNNSSVNVTGV